MLPPSRATVAGRRLADRVHDTARAIGRVVPASFAAYARVFPRASEGGARLRWSDLAGPALTATTQWEDIVPIPRATTLTVPEGSLDAETSDSLGRVLAQHTPTVSATFGIWDGYADSAAYVDYPSVVLPPDRRILLLEGSLESASTTLDGSEVGRRPTRWWPDDLSWCVGADIYSRAVLVAGTVDCISDILNSDVLEGVPVNPDDPLLDL